MTDIVKIFTDGACSGNPGPGGWAALIRARDLEEILSGGEPRTTNNRMELMAAIMALEWLERPRRVRLATDSQYLQLGITQWIQDWKKRGWVTSRKTLVKNVDLWQRLESAAGRHEIQWQWVKGHSLHEENTIVDKLARQALEKFL